MKLKISKIMKNSRIKGIKKDIIKRRVLKTKMLSKILKKKQSYIKL
jgi:hypothetical protein